MIRLGVVLWKVDVFVHVERNDMLESMQNGVISKGWWNHTIMTHETLPAFTSLMSA